MHGSKQALTAKRAYRYTAVLVLIAGMVGAAALVAATPAAQAAPRATASSMPPRMIPEMASGGAAQARAVVPAAHRGWTLANEIPDPVTGGGMGNALGHQRGHAGGGLRR